METRDAVFHPFMVTDGYGRTPAAKVPSVTSPWAGLLASGSFYLPRLPDVKLVSPFDALCLLRVILLRKISGFSMRLSYPVTAAGPRRIRTVFP